MHANGVMKFSLPRLLSKDAAPSMCVPHANNASESKVIVYLRSSAKESIRSIEETELEKTNLIARKQENSIQRVITLDFGWVSDCHIHSRKRLRIPSSRQLLHAEITGPRSSPDGERYRLRSQMQSRSFFTSRKERWQLKVQISSSISIDQ